MIEEVLWDLTTCFWKSNMSSFFLFRSMNTASALLFLFAHLFQITIATFSWSLLPCSALYYNSSWSVWKISAAMHDIKYSHQYYAFVCPLCNDVMLLQIILSFCETMCKYEVIVKQKHHVNSGINIQLFCQILQSFKKWCIRWMDCWVYLG